ncbi:hypothetical protein [Prescottella equi]|uniref:hypothetical protein n=1 Tax=Rhodococcus hoagii TaxID=43767 RepID=UPI0019F04A90|nr:hypothetical protein [Prescottella equi]
MSEHDKPRRRRLSTRQVVALLGLLVVAVVGAVSYFTVFADEPVGRADPDTSLEAGPPADSDADALAQARRSLQQTSLPLSLLNGGMNQLVDGGRQLDDGANQLSVGLGQARDGAGQLSAGLDQLSGGVGQLGDGAQQISGGVDEVVDRLSGLGELQGQVTGSLRQVAAALSASTDPVSQAASGRVNDLVAQLDAEGLGPDTLAQLAMLKDGARQLSYELSDPSAQFVSGVGQVADGARQLSDGLALLDDGGKALAHGTGQLVDGTGPITGVVQGLSTNVSDASKALPLAQTKASEADTAVQAAPDADRTPAWIYVAGALTLLLVVAAVARGSFVLGRRQMSPNAAA